MQHNLELLRSILNHSSKVMQNLPARISDGVAEQRVLVKLINISSQLKINIGGNIDSKIWTQFLAYKRDIAPTVITK